MRNNSDVGSVVGLVFEPENTFPVSFEYAKRAELAKFNELLDGTEKPFESTTPTKPTAFLSQEN